MKNLPFAIFMIAVLYLDGFEYASGYTDFRLAHPLRPELSSISAIITIFFILYVGYLLYQPKE